MCVLVFYASFLDSFTYFYIHLETIIVKYAMRNIYHGKNVELGRGRTRT